MGPFSPEDDIPKELQSVIESLAERAHEHWTAQRIRDGWTWGPERDDQARTHPCLVPYADLRESDREYDRRVVIGALKALLELGFRIARDGSR
jgi:hypothetical protein